MRDGGHFALHDAGEHALHPGGVGQLRVSMPREREVACRQIQMDRVTHNCIGLVYSKANQMRNLLLF